MFVILLMFAVFFVAALWYKRGAHAIAAIPVAALIAPALVAFLSLVYPADPKDKMWAMIAIPVSYAYALVASCFGCGLVALLRKAKKRDA